jgi:signal transduction histidine kinase
VQHPRPAVVDLAAAAVAVTCGLVGGLCALLDLVPQGQGPSFWAMGAAGALGYGGAAAVLAWHRRATVVRRVLLGIALSQGLSLVTAQYAAAGLAGDPHWPGAATALWIGSWIWSPGYVAVAAVLPLVLPDGRPLWRPAAVLAGVAVTAVTLTWALTPYELQDFPIRAGVENPVGVAVAASPAVVLGSAGLAVAAVVTGVTAAVVRWRRSSGVVRDQLTWLLVGVLFTVALGLAALLVSPAVAEVLTGLAMLPVPAAVGVALLRHRLWDVDLVLSRSLRYVLLSGGAVAAYTVAVALVAAVAGRSAGAPVLATAATALLVLPLHTRVQRLVNRLVYGDVDDPYTALARLGDRLEAAAGPGELADRVLPDLVERVARTLHRPYVAVELADGTTTAHGEATDAAVRTPLVHSGQEVGRLVVGGGEVPRGERRLLEHLAGQAAVAVHFVLLSREVQRARALAATAREEERRRMRRDLHDGMGPALAAVALQAETARDIVTEDPQEAAELLDTLVPRLRTAVQDVRTLVHDLRPPTLDELGLAGSVRELATRFATPARSVEVLAADEELTPLPAAVDVAAYRIVAESLANVAKHSGATTVRLELARENGCLHVRVDDDGVGLRPGRPRGVGLSSMRERAEELGGSCTVTAGPQGRGTAVRAVLPVQREGGR